MATPAVPVPTILRIRTVTALTGLSKSTIYSYMSGELFPPSISLGPRTVGWLETDIQQWVDSRVRARREGSR